MITFSRIISILVLIWSGTGLTRAQSIESFDPDEIIDISLKISTEDWDTLRYQHRSAEFYPQEGPWPPPSPYTWFDATLKVGEAKEFKVKVRKKGYIGSNSIVKPSLKVKILPDNGGEDAPENRRFTLNNNQQDGSHLKQVIAYQLFRDAGVTAPRANLAHVRINGMDLGIYTHLEPVRDAFLTRHFGESKGNLYEGGRSDFRTGWYQNFEKKNNRKDETRSDLAEVTHVLETKDEGLINSLEDHVDIEGFLKFWALESLIGHRDGYAGNVNNYYLYHSIETGKLVFIPWGVDTTFSSRRSRSGSQNTVHSVIAVGMLANKIYGAPEGREAYRAKMTWLLEEVWNESNLLRQVDALEKLVRPRLAESDSGFDQAVSSLRDFIRRRRSEVTPELEGEAPQLTATPMPLAKRRNVGHLSFSFRTQWSESLSRDAPPPSEASGEATLFGKPCVIESIEVRAGPRWPQDNQGRVAIFLVAHSGNSPRDFLRMRLFIEPGEYRSGTPIPIDMTRIKGRAMKSGAYGLLKGTLFIENAGHHDGEIVSGRVEADLYSKHEISD